MAIQFDTVNKIILLDNINVSASEIWSRWVDWLVIGDNIKYFPAFSQLGGVAPVALYIFLENGWKVRPVEADGITTITGNLLVQGGGTPVASTIGNFNVLVNMETPIAAQAIEIQGGSGLSTAEHNKLFSVDSDVWSNPTRTLTSAGANGATAQEVWEYGTRELTSGSVSGTVDANIVSVQGTSVTDVTDFQGGTATVNPADIWNYSTRELTVASGMTPAQEAKIDTINTEVDSILASMPALDEANVNSLYAKILAVKNELDALVTSNADLPNQFWNEIQ